MKGNNEIERYEKEGMKQRCCFEDEFGQSSYQTQNIETGNETE